MTDAADALVVFGITGDLARRSTLPALYDLSQQGLLTCPVIGVGRRPVSDDEMRRHATEAIEAAEGREVDEAVLSEFLARLQYIGGDAEAEEDPLYEPTARRARGLAASRLLSRDAVRRCSTRSPRSSRRRGSSVTPAVSSWRSRSGPTWPPRAS